MPVTSDKQDIGRMKRLKAFADVAGFSESGVQLKGADAYLWRHVFIVGVFPQKRFCVFGGGVAEIAGVRRGVEQQVARVAGAQQFHAAAIAFILAITGQDHDDIRFFRAVAYEQTAGESGK